MKRYIFIIVCFSFSLMAQDPTYNFYFNADKKNDSKKKIEKDRKQEESHGKKASKPEIKRPLKKETALNKKFRLNYAISASSSNDGIDNSNFYLESINTGLQSLGLSYRLTERLHVFGNANYSQSSVSLWNPTDPVSDFNPRGEKYFHLNGVGIDIGLMHFTEFGGITFEHKLTGRYLKYSNSFDLSDEGSKLELKTMALSYSVGPTLYFENFIFNIGAKAIFNRHKLKYISSVSATESFSNFGFGYFAQVALGF